VRISSRCRAIGLSASDRIDYEGDWCPDPACAFWHGRDQFTHKLVAATGPTIRDTAQFQKEGAREGTERLKNERH